MKKINLLLCAVMMSFICCINASAAKSLTKYDEFSSIGVDLYLPDEYVNSVAQLEIYADDFSNGEGAYGGYIYYVGCTKEDYKALNEKEDLTDEEIEEVINKTLMLVGVVAIDDNRGADELAELSNDYFPQSFSADQLTYIGKDGDCSFYSVEPTPDTEQNYKNLDKEFKEEYDQLSSLRGEIVTNLQISKVERPYTDMLGKTVSFETKDLDGNTISSKDIFSQNEITMVNVWATWCPPCVGELERLEALNKEFADKNCAIIGLCGDAEDEESINGAKELLNEFNVTYLNIVPFDGWYDDFGMVGSWPESFFVDKDGKIIAPPVIGANIKAYELRIDKLLSNKNTEE